MIEFEDKMKIKLNVVPIGYELNIKENFICRDFGDTYEDQEILEVATMVAIFDFFEKDFEERLAKVYEFLSTKTPS
jgi:hypothetical protein